MEHECKVCHFSGKFEEKQVITYVNTSSVTVLGEGDSCRGSYPTEVVGEVEPYAETLHVCPNCRIVYSF